MKRMSVCKISCIAFLATMSAAVPASASEVVTYVYDAHGRLVKVQRSGTVNNGVTTDYQYDKADNRTRVKTTGSN